MALPAARLATESGDRAFFGHPRGLSTLFFTEMWERFSYYGMRALLILFMTASPATGGLGFDAATAGAIYGLYTAMVYMFTLPGGWIADRADRPAARACWPAASSSRPATSAWPCPSLTTFYLGLVLIVIGTGLLKGNVSVIVGRLYSAGDARRDAGFSIFYMGINTGAFVAPFVCGYLGQRVELAPWIRRRRRRHGARARAVRAGPQAPGRGRPAPGRIRARPSARAAEAARPRRWIGAGAGAADPVRPRHLRRA